MFAKFHALRERDERGFTLIELLVVILIIAILAAIAIPVFLKQREKGWVSQMESAVKNAATAAESYATSQATGNYVSMDASALGDQGWKYASSISTVVVNMTNDNNEYCISVLHSSVGADKYMSISSDVTAPTKSTTPCANGTFTANSW